MADFMMPQDFLANPLSARVFGLVDCRDILSQTVRKDSAVGSLQYSSKSSGSALRVLAMITPAGQPILASPVALGRAEEMGVCDRCSYMFDVVPDQWCLLADRGFRYLARALPFYQTVVVPAFKNVGKDEEGVKVDRQFSQSQLASSKDNAVKRYTIEVFFSRSAAWKRADDVVPRQDFKSFDSFWYVSAGFTMFMAPLRQPHGAEKYKTLLGLYSAAVKYI
jgi:hypothetical protein